MRRWLLFSLLVCATLSAQSSKKNAPQPEEQAPPEEDASLATKEYSFNPLQADKEIKAGDYYFKKGKYRGAVNRYLEATRWNATLPEAFLKLGEAEEKEHDRKAAREAYEKYLSLAPEGKNAGEIRKKLGRL